MKRFLMSKEESLSKKIRESENPHHESKNRDDEKNEKPEKKEEKKEKKRSKAELENEQLLKKKQEMHLTKDLVINEEMQREMVRLSADQKQAFEDIVYKGLSVFITGPGGVGKSFLISMIKKAWMKTKREFWLTATTGVAAVNLGGTTIHSASGVWPRDGESAKDIVGKMNAFTKKNWKAVQSIILDEISMMEPSHLNLLDEVGRIIKGKPGEPSKEPFGGIQVILCGDFFQLPPIHKDISEKRQKDPSFCEFCYQLPRWNLARPLPHSSSSFVKVEKGAKDEKEEEKEEKKNIFSLLRPQSDKESGYFHKIIPLHEPFRQTNLDFFHLLNRARFGIPSPQDIEFLKTRVHASLETAPGVVPTKLYPTNFNVDATNLKEFSCLNSAGARTYTAKAGFTKDYEENSGFNHQKQPEPFDSMDRYLSSSLSSCSAVFSAGGSDSSAAVKMMDCEEEVRKLEKNNPVGPKLDLRIGAQIMLVANVNIAQGLVNGSRGVVEGFSGLFPNNPLVRFNSMINKKTGKTRSEVVEIEPYAWKSPLGTPVLNGVACKGYVTYSQIPLRHAWAISIHKSQSITLDCLEVDIGPKIFAPGQAYVALSRSRTENFILSAFSPAAIKSHPDTVSYYLFLENESVQKGNPPGRFVPIDIYNYMLEQYRKSRASSQSN